jgi:hypothetical protein
VIALACFTLGLCVGFIGALHIAGVALDALREYFATLQHQASELGAVDPLLADQEDIAP